MLSGAAPPRPAAAAAALRGRKRSDALWRGPPSLLSRPPAQENDSLIALNEPLCTVKSTHLEIDPLTVRDLQWGDLIDP